MLLLCLLLASTPALPQRVGHGPAAWEKVLAGKVDSEIVLSAPRGDASARAVVLAAVADLRRTPLRHTVRVVFLDGGGDGWLRDVGSGAERRILANLNLERVGWRGSAGPVIHIFPTRWGMAPGWLVYSVLKSGQAVGEPFAVADHRFPLLAQLVARSAKIRHRSNGERFLKRGIPSVTLSDSSLLVPGRPAGGLDPDGVDRWARAVAAAVRRLDALAGRPRPEDQYLVIGGRVWLRRDLMWVGFLAWALLVFRGRPGRWRGGSAQEHGRQMRSYLPGFLFRALLLAAVFLAPVFAVLLLPVAALALFPPRPVWARVLWIAAGLLPLVVYLAALGVALQAGIASFEDGFQGGAPATVLIPAALFAWGVLVARGPAPRVDLTITDVSGKLET